MSMQNIFDFSALSTFGLVLQQSLLGPIIGWLAAILEGFILQRIYNDALAEITITLSFTYLTFHIGEVVRPKQGFLKRMFDLWVDLVFSQTWNLAVTLTFEENICFVV